MSSRVSTWLPFFWCFAIIRFGVSPIREMSRTVTPAEWAAFPNHSFASYGTPLLTVPAARLVNRSEFDAALL